MESSSDDKAPAESMRKTQHSARCGMCCGRPVRVLRLVDTWVAISECHLPAEPQRTYCFYHIYVPAHSLLQSHTRGLHSRCHFLSPNQTTRASRHEQAWETVRAPAGRKQSPRSGAGLASKAGRPGASGAARPLAAASSGAVPQGASGAAQAPAAAANGAALRRSSANRAAAGDSANGRQLSDFLPAALQRSARLAPTLGAPRLS